jgi:hypothetical protein
LKRPDGSEYTPPLFYRSYNLTTAEENNAQGSWMAWAISRGVSLPELNELRPWKDILKDAVEFYKMLSAGEARADLAAMRDDMHSDADEVM